MTRQVDLEKLKSLHRRFEDRKARAKERHANEPLEGWSFGLLGFQLDQDEYRIDPIAIIRRVVEPPGEIELAGALKDPSLFSKVATYSHAIQFELTVLKGEGDGSQSAFTLAWWFVVALRARTLAEIIVPVASDHSWSVIAGIAERTVEIRFLEDVPKAIRLETPKTVTTSELDWVFKHITSLAALLENPRFRLASECLSSHHQQENIRMASAALWTGIEAFIGVQSELRFRVAAYVSSYLEDRGESRLRLFAEVKKQYDTRSKVVHGAAIAEGILEAHVKDVKKLLSRMICTAVEQGKLPGENDWDSLLLN